VPPGAVAFKVAVLPEQMVTPEAVGAAGVGAAVTVTELEMGAQPVVLSETVTVYVPTTAVDIVEIVAPVLHR